MNALTIGKLGAFRPAPFNRAQRVAEQNATDMLGMPAGNTAAQRADAQGWVDAYHGAGRLDRLLEKPGLDPKRATSGPMPYLTDDAVMASNYAKNKADTSRLADQDGNYSDWFKVSIGSGKPKRLDDAWYYLPPDEKRALADRLSRVTESEDDAGRLVMGEGPGGRGHWEHTLKEHRGNALAAAREIWLDSANLFGREDEFLNVLSAAGFKAPVKYDSPHLALPGVLPAKVRMTNPLNTANDEAVVFARAALADAAKGKRAKDRRGGVDPWDKNSIGIREFLERLDDDIANGTTHAWTSIPDDVTAVLKRLGYDGIVDTGGKMGGDAHKVMIPFAPNQVRSRFAAFDPAKRDSSDLLAGLVPAAAAGALGLQMMPTEEPAGALALPR